jgi:Tfp pilus assembly PilM family ATPase
MANRVLGIEYSEELIKVVEVSFARKLKVFNFAVVDTRNVDPARRAEQLQHTIQVRGFEARDALVAASGGTVEHRLLTLPPLSGREMHFVMQRESKKLAPGGMAEMLWSYDVLRTKEELGIKKNQILLVTAERPMVDGIQALLSQTKLRLQQVTTIPEAVLNLARQAGPWKKDAVRMIVHFAGTQVHIIFAQDGVLLLSRDIRFDYADLDPEEQSDRLVNELKRSALYFRQNFPQTQLEEIVFSGDGDILGTLSRRSTEELGIGGSILRFEDSLDTSGFRGNWDEFRFHLPSLAAAFGASWRKSPGSSGINLLPGKALAKQEAGLNPTKVAKAAFAASLVFALGAGGYWMRAKGQVDAELLEIAQRSALVDPELAQAEQLEQRRSGAAVQADFLMRLGPTADWSEILRNLSYLLPQTAVFEQLRVESGAAPKLVLRGNLIAATPAEANADFSRFFNDLGTLPFFKSVAMSSPLSTSFENVSGATPVSVVVRSKVSFEVQCLLR